MSELRGCTDGNCIIRKPEGMHTNGGCGCERELRHALGLQDSRRFIHALRERQREVAELREALREAANHAANLGVPEAMLDRWDALISPPAQGGSVE